VADEGEEREDVRRQDQRHVHLRNRRKPFPVNQVNPL
jgi:hypothetical protein